MTSILAVSLFGFVSMTRDEHSRMERLEYKRKTRVLKEKAVTFISYFLRARKDRATFASKLRKVRVEFLMENKKVARSEIHHDFAKLVEKTDRLIENYIGEAENVLVGAKEVDFRLAEQALRLQEQKEQIELLNESFVYKKN